MGAPVQPPAAPRPQARPPQAPPPAAQQPARPQAPQEQAAGAAAQAPAPPQQPLQTGDVLPPDWMTTLDNAADTGVAQGVGVFAAVNEVKGRGGTKLTLTHTTSAETAGKIIESQLRAGSDGVRWLNQPELTGQSSPRTANTNLHFDLTAKKVTALPDEVMQQAKAAGEAAVEAFLNSDEAKGLNSRQKRNYSRRRALQAVGDFQANWVKNNGKPGTVYTRPLVKGGETKGLQYLINDDAWGKAKPKLTKVSGEGAEALMESLAKKLGAADDVAKAAGAKWGNRVAVAGKWGGRALVVVGVAASGYEIYRAEDKVKATVKEAGGWAVGAGGAWAGAKGGAALGAFGGPWGAAAGGVIGGIAGGIGGYWAGSEGAEEVYEYFFEPGI